MSASHQLPVHERSVVRKINHNRMPKRVRDSFNGLKKAIYSTRAAEQEFLLTQQGDKVEAKELADFAEGMKVELEEEKSFLTTTLQLYPWLDDALPFTNISKTDIENAYIGLEKVLGLSTKSDEMNGTSQELDAK